MSNQTTTIAVWLVPALAISTLAICVWVSAVSDSDYKVPPHATSEAQLLANINFESFGFRIEGIDFSPHTPWWSKTWFAASNDHRSLQALALSIQSCKDYFEVKGHVVEDVVRYEDATGRHIHLDATSLGQYIVWTSPEGYDCYLVAFTTSKRAYCILSVSNPNRQEPSKAP